MVIESVLIYAAIHPTIADCYTNGRSCSDMVADRFIHFSKRIPLSFSILPTSVSQPVFTPYIPVFQFDGNLLPESGSQAKL